MNMTVKINSFPAEKPEQNPHVSNQCVWFKLGRRFALIFQGQFPFQGSTYTATITWALLVGVTHSSCHQDLVLGTAPALGTILALGTSLGRALAAQSG